MCWPTQGQRALARQTLHRVDIAGADHTLSESLHRKQFEAASVDWLRAQGFR